MTITLFLFSLFVLVTLTGSKIFEIKFGKEHFLREFFLKGDEKIHGLVDGAYFKYNRYKKIANIFVFDFLPSYMYELLVKMKDYISKKYYSASIGNDFRGRRVLRSNGSVSFFLERLAEDKTHTDGNKI